MPPQPPEVLTAGRLYSPTSRFAWDFRPGVPDAAGPTFAAGLPHRAGQGLALTGPSDLEWPASFDASELDAVQVTLLYPHGSEAELFWKGPGQEFDPTRSLRQRRGDGRAGLSRTLTFELLSHPEWSGPIDHLLLRFGLGPTETRILEHLRGLRYVLEPEAFEDHTQRPWLVDLGHEFRTALIAPPDQPIERQLSLSGESVLNFAYGVSEGNFERIDFRISQLSREAIPKVLFEASVEPEEPRRWHSQSVVVAGKGPSRLVFETSSSTPGRAMPLWGNIELAPKVSTDPRPNILLISVDTLRADHLPSYGYANATAPRLTDWARQHATVFENAVTQAPWTLPSHTSIFTGLNATRHGVNHTHTVAPRRLDMLAEILRDAGYSTAAVTGGGFLHPKYGFAQGFDRFHYWPTLGEPENELETSVERCAELLAALTPPFFLFLHTFDVHDYLIYRRAAGAEEDKPSTWYDHRIRHTDTQFGRLLDRLDELGLRGRTAIVFTSDHGESLGEAGPRGHGFLTEDNLQVPLVVEFPDGHRAGHRVQQQVRSVDLAPTILELAGLSPASGLDGRSLLPLLDDRPVGFPRMASSYAAKRNLGLALSQGGRRKYIFPNTAWPALRGDDRLYDLQRDLPHAEELAADQSRLEPWRAQARRELESLPGIRLEFANPTSQLLSFRLHSRMLSEEGVKSVDLPCPCVKRERPFKALIETPPGTHFEIQLEEVLDDPLRIEAWAGATKGGAPFAETVQIDPSQDPWILRYVDEQWRSERSPTPDADSVLVLSWRSGLDFDSESPIETDPDLRQRLRALGYLD